MTSRRPPQSTPFKQEAYHFQAGHGPNPRLMESTPWIRKNPDRHQARVTAPPRILVMVRVC